MSYSQTQITTRGYSVILPTAAVQGFLALSHDDRVELAEAINALDDDRFGDVDPEEDTGSVTDLLIESMARELDIQDQLIDAYIDDREELQSSLSDYRYNAFAAAAEIDNLEDIILQSSRYVGQAREMLKNLGITVGTSTVDGTPILEIDRHALVEAVYPARAA